MQSRVAVAAFLSAVLLSGCATHTSLTKDARRSWASGDMARASAEFSDASEDASGSGDELVWKLEEGAAARASGNLKKSVSDFKAAAAIIDEYESQPDISLTRETSAVLTNQSYLPYKGYNYDKIMLGVYQSLNYMELKEFDLAAVELIRVGNFQSDSERINRRRIEREAEALDKARKENAGGNYDASKSLSNPQVSAKLRQVYGGDFLRGQAAKGIYVNPFAYWLSGVYFANRAVDASDKNRAADMFRIGGQVAGGDSDVFKADLQMAEDLADGKISKPGGITYVVYEAGCAPVRGQFQINLPLYIVARNVPHVSLNFPYLVKQDSYSPDLRISAGGRSQKLETLADMDSIIGREFNDRLPAVLTKTVLSAAVKASAQYASARAAGDGWAALAINIAGSIYQTLMNDADLRTWTTLPKRIKVARFETPPDGRVLVEGRAVQVQASGVNVVLVKKTGPACPPVIRTFDFSDASRKDSKSGGTRAGKTAK